MSLKRRKISDDPVPMEIVPVYQPARRSLYKPRTMRTYRPATGLRRIYRRGYQPTKTAEFKYVDTDLSAQAVDTTGLVKLINGTAEGVGPSQHTGRCTTVRSIQLRFTNTVTVTSGIDQQHRIMLIYDRQTNAAAPAITDVLVSSSITSMRNLDFRNRFTVLMDKRIDLNKAGESGSQLTWDYYKMSNLPVQYDATADATVASISSGGLFLIILGTEAAGGTAGSITGTARVRYTDQ